LLLRGTALVFNCAVLVWLLRTTVPDSVYLRIPPVVTACNFLFSLFTIICTNNNVLVAMGNFLVFSLLYLMIFGFFIRNQLLTAGLGIGIIVGAILLFIIMPDRFFSRKLQIEEIRSAWNYIFVFGLLFTTLLVTLSNQIASMIISKTRETAERLRVMALYDQTTGFPNGLLLEQDMKVFDEMEHPNPEKKLVMVGFRLEGLEALNEIRGLAFTDSLVRELALTYRLELESQIEIHPEFGVPEPFKTMYRVESNTFVFMLNLPLVGQNDLSSKYLLVSVIDKMILEQQGKINLSFQGGFTVYPDDATSFDQLFRNLLNLLHSRRNESLGEFMPFNPAHYLEFLRQEQLGTCMDEALSTGEFTLAYQPKIEVSSGKLRGFEALARWKSPTLGVVSPGEFIPLAEQTGAIGRLTLHLFDITYDFVRKLREDNHPDIRVSVNLSPGLLNPEFLDRVIDDIEKNGLGPSLEFEITEGVLMKLNSLISTKFNRLKGLGVGFSIDDFGTGYSNLGYLQNFEADVLKIDKRFIDGIPLDEKNSKLVKAIMQMARSFNMLVVAEGVEYQEQRDFLFEHECDQIQGYFYSKPLTGEDAHKFVSIGK
jgi:EAL domain-containing protein (putative c-di-GMP-specific phosphodiesterase class I)/GGDEF domain-containing protein